ncbi:MAG TPA: fibronectin type III domain-containing protein [Gemmatimonadaceae bacterium]|nr:fibronectin type III domain-containing protein [Gemmatimonadaceae bacterium]
MRALARYSTPALTSLTVFAVACSDPVSPNPDASSFNAGASVADRKKPGTVPQPDVTPPTTPVLQAADVGRRHITLAWSSTDDRTYALIYSITVNGTVDPPSTQNTSRTFYPLQPSTTYAFTVRAKDNSGNVSDAGTLTVTTKALDPGDTQPPSAPTNVSAYDFGSGVEFQVTWSAASDNVDASSGLSYEVYVNGELSDSVFGKTQSINYGVPGTNTVAVIAIDSNGNRSSAGTTTIVLSE